MKLKKDCAAKFSATGRLLNASEIAADCGVRRETIWLAVSLTRAPGAALRHRLDSRWGIILPADPAKYRLRRGRW